MTVRRQLDAEPLAEAKTGARGQRVAPGKRSLASRLPSLGPAAGAPSASAPPVQLERAPAAGPGADPFAVHLAAQRGVRGGGEGLPHGEAIQRSFGHHDVAGIRAHVGGGAAEAARELGAAAYATGDDVAFAATPDLRQAAHEAAHVVQQRGGVRLDGGVGQAGDRYEQHADEVAALVVRGESAEALLDGLAHRGGAGGPAVQRFESHEHLRMGDEAATEGGVVGRVELSPGYTITNGEMVALAGDYFENIEEMRRLATNAGHGAGTREELEYARVCKATEDESRAGEFSAAARAAVDRRYYRLAARNASHFSAPNVGDTERSVADRAADAPRHEGEPLLAARIRVPPAPHSAIEGYRYNHARALGEACEAAHRLDTVESAMATEGFGAHFLTDSFSAGHVRTPRQSIHDTWNSRVPMFFTNFKGWVAEQVAQRIAAGISGLGLQLRSDIAMGGALGMDGARTIVAQRLDAIGPLGFGDLVSGALHDYDNVHGVRARSEGTEVELYGDGQAGRGAEEDLAVAAVRRGRAEVERAHQLGSEGRDPQSTVDGLLGADGLYDPERMIPEVLPDRAQEPDRRMIHWDVASVEQLLADPQFAEAARLFAESKAREMRAVADELEESQAAAIRSGVIDPLVADPISVLRAVVNWTPTITDSAAGHNTDDDSLDYVTTARATTGGMASLTPVQRERLMRHLLDGTTVGNEETALMEILTTAPADEARRLIGVFGWQALYDKIDDGPGEEFAERFPRAQFGG
ncbi:MAG: DUF4157 domain-containing protein [Kofleriaceae bacterium]